MIGGRERGINQVFGAVPLVGFFVLFPVIFSPVFGDAYDLPKLLLLTITSVVISGLWFWANWQKKAFQLTLSPFLTGVVVLTLVSVLSAKLASPNFYMSFLNLPMWLVFGLVFFGAVSSFYTERRIAKWSLVGLFIATVVLAIIAIYQYFGVLNIVFKWAPLESKVWTPAGGVLNLIYYLVVGFVIGFLLAWEEKHEIKRVVYFLASAVVMAGLVLLVSLLFGNDPSYRLQLLPFKTAWVIGMEVVKNFPLFGVGPGLFLSAFNRFRDIGYNTTSLWGVRFGVSRDTPFHLLSEMGLLGLIGWGMFWGIVLLVVRKNWSRTKNSMEGRVLSVVLILSFIYQLVFTASAMVWVMVIGFLALYVVWLSSVESGYFKRLVVALEAASVGASGAVKGYKSGIIVNVLAMLIVALIIGFSGFLGVRYAWAEYHYAKALEAGRNNDAQGLLAHLGQAIKYYPWLDRYHMSVAQVHFNVIDNILKKKADEITDQDKRQLQASIQVALAQARAAVQLNPVTADDWAFLARIYARIIGVAQGSDQWAIGTYRQAIALDPVNPVLRTTLAGLLYGLNNIDGAIEQARLAAQAKPDYANAWYNLAVAYKKKGDYFQAFAAMQRVLATLPINSPDRERAQKEFDELKRKVQEIQKQQQEQLRKAQQQRQQQQTTPTLAPLPTPTPILTKPTPIPTKAQTQVEVPKEKLIPPLTITPTPSP